MSHNLLYNWLLPLGIIFGSPFILLFVGIIITLPANIHFNGERARQDDKL